MKKIYATLLASAAMASVPQAVPAQQLPPPPPANWVLDNFATAKGRVAAVTGTQTITLPATGTSSEIIGGSRYISLNTGTNPYLQPIVAEVRPSASTTAPSSFLMSVGFGGAPEISLIYGVTTGPLNLNLTGYDRLRIAFGGLSSGLNDLDLVFEQGSGIAAACSTSVAPSSSFNSDPVAFTVDFPLSNFTANSGPPVDWSDIQLFDIILIGPNLSITKFLAIPIGSTEPAANFTCGASAS
jgi:hypothetical protein